MSLESASACSLSACSSPSAVAVPPVSGQNCRCRCLRPLARLAELVWRHFLPFAPLAHLASILLLVLPDLVYTPGDELRADIDEAYANTTACRQLGNSSSQCLLNRLFAPDGGLLAKLLPLNVETATSATVTATASSGVVFHKEHFLRQVDLYSVELVSLCLAYATLSIRYGSVFWYTNKTLSYIITFIG